MTLSGGDALDLGIVRLRLLAAAEQTNGAFAVGEFFGEEGPWDDRRRLACAHKLRPL